MPDFIVYPQQTPLHPPVETLIDEYPVREREPVHKRLARKQADISRLLPPQISAYRGWSSSFPNERLILTCAGYRYGTVEGKRAEGWDQEAYVEATAARDAWRYPVVAVKNVPLCAQNAPQPFERPRDGDDAPQSHTDAPTGKCKRENNNEVVHIKRLGVGGGKRVTNAELNLAYETYFQDPGAHRDLMNTTLFLFVWNKARFRSASYRLLEGKDWNGDAEDIVQQFAINLMHRFEQGQYHTHSGKMQRWVSSVWSKYFLPDMQTEVYTDLNLTVRVNEEDKPKEDDGVPGEVYREDVDSALASRDIEVLNNPRRIVSSLLRALNNPQSAWSAFDKPTKDIIRNMARGMKKEKAATVAGVSARQGLRLLNKVAELAKKDPQMREQLFYASSEVTA